VTGGIIRLGEIRSEVAGPGGTAAVVPGPEEADVTEEEVRAIVNEEVTKVLNHGARKISGIASWERYLANLLEAARKD